MGLWSRVQSYYQQAKQKIRSYVAPSPKPVPKPAPKTTAPKTTYTPPKPSTPTYGGTTGYGYVAPPPKPSSKVSGVSGPIAPSYRPPPSKPSAPTPSVSSTPTGSVGDIQMVGPAPPRPTPTEAPPGGKIDPSTGLVYYPGGLNIKEPEPKVGPAPTEKVTLGAKVKESIETKVVEPSIKLGEKFREATTHKVMPTWKEWQKEILKGYGIETRQPKEGEKPGLYVGGAPVTKAPKVKESAWTAPNVERLYGFEKTSYTELREHPLRITALGVASFGVSAISTAGVLPHVPVVGPAIKYGLSTAYITSVGLRLKAAEGPEAQGEEAGRILVGEVIPVAVGGRLGSDVGAAYKRWRAPVFEFRIFEDVAPRQIQFRDVGGKLEPEWGLGPSRVYERKNWLEPELAQKVLSVTASEWVAGKKYTGPKLKTSERTPWKSTFPETIYTAPTEVTPPTTPATTVVSGKQALLLEQAPKVKTLTITTKVAVTKPVVTTAPPFTAFAPVSVRRLLKFLEAAEVPSGPMALTIPTTKEGVITKPVVTPMRITKPTTTSLLKTKPMTKTFEVTKVADILGTKTVPSLSTITSVGQITGVKTTPITTPITATTTTAITTTTPAMPTPTKVTLKMAPPPITPFGLPVHKDVRRRGRRGKSYSPFATRWINPFASPERILGIKPKRTIKKGKRKPPTSGFNAMSLMGMPKRTSKKKRGGEIDWLSL
ncbi:MAG: hypothetical protein ACXQTR_05030 [Candidatus Methanospirareceae archaeon]